MTLINISNDYLFLSTLSKIRFDRSFGRLLLLNNTFIKDQNVAEKSPHDLTLTHNPTQTYEPIHTPPATIETSY